MQLAAFNSTPRDAQTSKTDQILKAFLAGAQEAGAECELIHLRNYKLMAWPALMAAKQKKID